MKTVFKQYLSYTAYCFVLILFVVDVLNINLTKLVMFMPFVNVVREKKSQNKNYYMCLNMFRYLFWKTNQMTDL